MIFHFVALQFIFLHVMTEEETVNYEELLPSVKELREKCVRILNQCQEWNQESPIDGLHRYTNAVTSEMHFLEKVGPLIRQRIRY